LVHDVRWPSQQSSFSLQLPPRGRQQFESLKSNDSAQSVRSFGTWQHWLLVGSQLAWRRRQPWQKLSRHSPAQHSPSWPPSQNAPSTTQHFPLAQVVRSPLQQSPGLEQATPATTQHSPRWHD
jgi:hypothetical protein